MASGILAAITLFAALRELDFMLDHLIPLIGWKIAGIIPLVIIWYTYKCRLQFLTQLETFTQTRAFTILWSGFILIIIVAQLLGHSELFHAMMGDSYKRFYKRVIEESAEFLGYIMLLCGTIEYGFCAHLQKYPHRKNNG